MQSKGGRRWRKSKVVRLLTPFHRNGGQDAYCENQPFSAVAGSTSRGHHHHNAAVGMDCWLVWIRNKVIKRPSKTDGPAFVIAIASFLWPRGGLSIPNGTTSMSQYVADDKTFPPFPPGLLALGPDYNLVPSENLKWGQSDKGEGQRSPGYDS
jgi:hypothetical protein